MPLPHTIANGQNPDGTKLQANFAYLLALISGGAGIFVDTYANIRTAAAADPTTPFLCIASAPDNLFLLYCGDATAGDGGFITISSWVSGGIS